MPLARIFFVATLLHVYIAVRLGLALADHSWAVVVLVAVLAVSAVSMPTAMLARGIRHAGWADKAAWVGMLSMGLFSGLLVLTLLRDVLLLFVDIVDAVWPSVLQAAHLSFAELTIGSARAVPLLAVAGSAIGFVNARRIARVVRVDVPIEGLPAALQGFSIVQLSDIHVGPTIKRGYVRAIVERANALEADMVALTGDLVDDSVERLAGHVAPLGGLRSRYGSFFVTGNHEYYSGAAPWVREFRRLGMHVLLNEHEVIEQGSARLVVGGVTDYNAGHFDAALRSDPEAALLGAPRDAGVRVLLAHQPRSAAAAERAGFDLQLSGHTHGGQFWPWNLFVPLQQPYVHGLHRQGRLWIYTSRGTGYWGPPKRVGAPSEITLIRLVAAPAQSKTPRTERGVS